MAGTIHSVRSDRARVGVVDDCDDVGGALAALDCDVGTLVRVLHGPVENDRAAAAENHGGDDDADRREWSGECVLVRGRGASHLGLLRCKAGCLVGEAVVVRVSRVHGGVAVRLTVVREVVVVGRLGGDLSVAAQREVVEAAVGRDENAMGVGYAEEAMVVREAHDVDRKAEVVEHGCRHVDVHGVEDVVWSVDDPLAHGCPHRSLDEEDVDNSAETLEGLRYRVDPSEEVVAHLQRAERHMQNMVGGDGCSGDHRKGARKGFHLPLVLQVWDPSANLGIVVKEQRHGGIQMDWGASMGDVRHHVRSGLESAYQGHAEKERME